MPPVPMPPPPPGPPRHVLRTVLTVAAAAVVLLLICGVCNAGFFLVDRLGAKLPSPPSPSASPAPLAKRDCVKPAGPGKYDRTSCKDAKRTGEVLGVIEGGEYVGQDCDPASDQLIAQDFTMLCVRHAGSRHVSAAGFGGGVFVPGDCVRLKLDLLLTNPTEVPCSQPQYEAKLIARVNTEAECKAPAVRAEKLISDLRPVLCLAAGPSMAGPGQCLRVQNSEVHLAAVPCTAGTATHKVLARKSDDAACPSATTSYTWDYDALPYAKIVCLRKR